MSAEAKKGDVLELQSGVRRFKVTVQWSQGAFKKDRREDYNVMEAWLNGGSVLLFRAVGKDDNASGTTFTVDDRYQWGQVRTNRRFLILHDKERTPYQDRFLYAALNLFGGGMSSDQAARRIQETIIGWTSVNTDNWTKRSDDDRVRAAMSSIQPMIGREYLRNF